MTKEELEQIADEYYDLIEKPAAAKRSPQFSLCIIGLVGAGKSTVLRKLCEHIPMVCESGDEVRKLLFEKNLPQFDSATIAKIGERVIDRLKREGYRVAYDNDFANPEIRAAMLKHNQRLGTPVLWIRIMPPEDFIINKLRNYKHTYLFSDADEAIANYVKRKAFHQREAAALAVLPYISTFDTSSPNLDQQVADAAKKIERQLSQIALKRKVANNDRRA